MDIRLDNILDLQEVFDRIIEKRNILKRNRPLPQMALSKIKEAMSIEWTYNSNSIEGSTITLRETQMIIQEGITVGGKSMREHFETYNHDQAITFLYDLASEKKVLEACDVLDVHAIVLNNIDKTFAGRLRNGQVRISGANFIPPNARKVATLLDDLIEFSNDNPLGLNDIVMAALFHHQFVHVHPFFDGNGRTVRLLMNLFLIRKGYPPAIILSNDRKKYYTALNQANKGNYRKLILVIAQAMERSLNIYLSALPDGDEYDTISNVVADPAIPYGQEYISLLARQGKIDAYKEGRNWVTSKKAILNYMKHHPIKTTNKKGEAVTH